MIKAVFEVDPVASAGLFWRATCSLAVGLALAAALVGCMAPPYKPPVSGATATLTISRASGSKSGRLFSYLFEDGIGINNGLKCKGKAALEPIDFDSDESRVTQVVAGRRTLIVLSEYNKIIGTTCYLAVTFEPKDGARYQATWSSSGNQCFVKVGRLESFSNGEVLVPELTTSRDSERC